MITLVPGQLATITGGFGLNNTTISLPNDPTPGNFVVIGTVSNLTSTNPTTVADSNGNNYVPTLSTPFAGSSQKLGIFYLENTPGNATKNITITEASVTTGFQVLFAAEFTTVDLASSFEGDAAVTFGGPNATINAPSITSINNGDLLIGVTDSYDTLISANSPWNAIAITAQQSGAEYYIQPAAGPQAVNFTQASSVPWDAMIAAFKAGAGPPANPPSLVFNQKFIIPVTGQVNIT